MTSLAAELTAIAQAAFAAEGLSPELGAVQVSDRQDLAQFQCNGALPAAKQAKANPRAIAEKIAARLKANPIFTKVEIAGPGFINLDVADDRGAQMADMHRLGDVRPAEIHHGRLAGARLRRTEPYVPRHCTGAFG